MGALKPAAGRAFLCLFDVEFFAAVEAVDVGVKEEA